MKTMLVSILATGYVFRCHLVNELSSIEFVCLSRITSDRHSSTVVSVVRHEDARVGDFTKLYSFRFDDQCYVEYLGEMKIELRQVYVINSKYVLTTRSPNPITREVGT